MSRQCQILSLQHVTTVYSRALVALIGLVSAAEVAVEGGEAASDLARAASEAVVLVGGDAKVGAPRLLPAADRRKAFPCHRSARRVSEVGLIVLTRKTRHPLGQQTWCCPGR